MAKEIKFVLMRERSTGEVSNQEPIGVFDSLGMLAQRIDEENKKYADKGPMVVTDRNRKGYVLGFVQRGWHYMFYPMAVGYNETTPDEVEEEESDG